MLWQSLNIKLLNGVASSSLQIEMLHGGKLASIDTCSSSCMDAASGSPSATRAIIVSEIILIEDNNPRRQVSALSGSVNLRNFVCFCCQL